MIQYLSLLLRHVSFFPEKTFTYRWEFGRRTLESNRIDDLIPERLVHSPYVAGVYGFCAQSILNEMGTSILENYIPTAQLSWTQKLRHATDAARALADVHSIDDPTGQWVSLAHGDIRTWNFLLTNDDRLKIHDFNAAMLFQWDVGSNSICEPVNMEIACNSNTSPEECVNFYKMSRQMDVNVDDFKWSAKKDVYEFGNILYFILTGYRPYHYPRHINRVEGGELVLKRILSIVPRDIVELGYHGEKAIMAILSAMKKCYRFMAEDRPSARDIADELALALEDVEKVK